jgi:hypothetical protein
MGDSVTWADSGTYAQSARTSPGGVPLAYPQVAVPCPMTRPARQPAPPGAIIGRLFVTGRGSR